jgi:hypothetical protein
LRVSKIRGGLDDERPVVSWPTFDSVDALAPIAPRLANLIRMLASDKDGEVLAAVAALKRTLAGSGADLHTLAASVESANSPGGRRWVRSASSE